MYIHRPCAAFLLDVDVVVVGGRRLQAAAATAKKSNKMPKKTNKIKYNKPNPKPKPKRGEMKRNET